MIHQQAHPPRAPHHVRRRHGPIPLIGGHRPHDFVLRVRGQAQELGIVEMHKGAAEAGEEQGGRRGGDGDAVGVGVVGGRAEAGGGDVSI